MKKPKKLQATQIFLQLLIADRRIVHIQAGGTNVRPVPSSLNVGHGGPKSSSFGGPASLHRVLTKTGRVNTDQFQDIREVLLCICISHDPSRMWFIRIAGTALGYHRASPVLPQK